MHFQEPKNHSSRELPTIIVVKFDIGMNTYVSLLTIWSVVKFSRKVFIFLSTNQQVNVLTIGAGNLMHRALMH